MIVQHCQYIFKYILDCSIQEVNIHNCTGIVSCTRLKLQKCIIEFSMAVSKPLQVYSKYSICNDVIIFCNNLDFPLFHYDKLSSL